MFFTAGPVGAGVVWVIGLGTHLVAFARELAGKFGLKATVGRD